MCSRGQERRKEGASGLITVAILKILSKEPLYGYAIMRVMESIFGDKIDKASIYMALRRLEEKGYVASEWVTGDSGPAKRVYKLTERGKQALERKLNCLVKLINVCKRILEY